MINFFIKRKLINYLDYFGFMSKREIGASKTLICSNLKAESKLKFSGFLEFIFSLNYATITQKYMAVSENLRGFPKDRIPILTSTKYFPFLVFTVMRDIFLSISGSRVENNNLCFNYY